MSSHCLYNHGQRTARSDQEGVAYLPARILHAVGSFSCINDIAEAITGQNSCGRMFLQKWNMTPRHTNRLKKRNLSADISLSAIGIKGERVRFLVCVDKRHHQYT